MSTIRDYKAGDKDELKRIFRQQNFEYDLPDLNGVMLPIRMVLEHNSEIRMAAVARITAEVYFLIDNERGTPQERWEQFQQLHREGLQRAHFPGGLDDLHCWIAPRIERSFGRRLKRLGWSKALWPSYSIGVPTHG